MKIQLGYNNPLFKHSPCPMWIVDRETLQFLVVNQATIDKYGYSKKEFLNMNLSDIRVDGEVTNGMKLNEMFDSRKEGAFYDMGNSRHKRKNGSFIYVHVYFQYIQFNGRSAVLGFLINENEKVLADIRNDNLNETIRRQKERLEDILFTADAVIWATRADTNELIYTNSACYKIYGYTPEEMMNDKSLFFNSIHPDDKEHFYDSMHKMLTTGSSESEFRVFHKDGTIRYLQGTAHLKKGDVDEFDICSGITVDITELRTAEADLVKKANEISAQNETLKEIAWIHSHKVRSEIATILGLIQLFKYNDSTDEENMTILEGIKKASTNLDAITREINEKAQPLRHLK